MKTKNWYSDNPCRIASQIVTGVEMMQIIFMVEQMQQLKLKWLPVSLHHDGCALLVEESSFEESREKLVEALKQRLEPSDMQIKGLEFTPYNEKILPPEETDPVLRVPDNRIL